MCAVQRVEDIRLAVISSKRSEARDSLAGTHINREGDDALR